MQCPRREHGVDWEVQRVVGSEEDRGAECDKGFLGHLQTSETAIDMPHLLVSLLRLSAISVDPR